MLIQSNELAPALPGDNKTSCMMYRIARHARCIVIGDRHARCIVIGEITAECMHAPASEKVSRVRELLPKKKYSAAPSVFNSRGTTP